MQPTTTNNNINCEVLKCLFLCFQKQYLVAKAAGEKGARPVLRKMLEAVATVKVLAMLSKCGQGRRTGAALCDRKTSLQGLSLYTIILSLGYWLRPIMCNNISKCFLLLTSRILRKRRRATTNSKWLSRRNEIASHNAFSNDERHIHHDRLNMTVEISWINLSSIYVIRRTREMTLSTLP